MTALDIIVLFLIGAGAVFGFLRGFVQEVLSLIAWIVMLVAIRLFHAPATDLLAGFVGTRGGAAVLAFLILLVISFAIGRAVARGAGRRTRASVLGPVDRVLGFGFGAIKGLLAATLLFLLVVLVLETVAGRGGGRPEWMVRSRTYPLMSASGAALSDFVKRRRAMQAAPPTPS